MKKRYLPYNYYKLSSKKRNLKKIFSIFVLFIFLFLLITKIFVYFKQIININEIEIISNTTTIPNEVIIDYFTNNKTSFLNYKKHTDILMTLYPEIYKVKTYFFPLKKFKIEVIGKTPFFYKNLDGQDKKLFYSNENSGYTVYNDNKIDLSKIILIEHQTKIDIDKLKKIYVFLSETNYIRKIHKIFLKNNREYIIYLHTQNKVVLDETIDILKYKNLLKDILDFSLDKKVDIYARLLDNNKVFLKY